MSVMKENGTKRLIDQILASLKVGKYAIMDKALNINSKNPVENKVITQAIHNANERISIVEDEMASFSGWKFAGYLHYENGSTDVVDIMDIEDVTNLLVLTTQPVLNQFNTMWIVSKQDVSNFEAVRLGGTSGEGANIEINGYSNGIGVGFDIAPVTGAEYNIPVFYQILNSEEE